MRVLFVISGLGLGGAERQIVLLSRELVRLGNDVSVYTLTRMVPRMDELDGNVNVIVDQKRRRLDFNVIRRLRQHIRCWRPDVVHGFLYDGNIYSRLAAFGLQAAVLNSERSDCYPLSLVQRVGYRLTARLCDGLVANSYSGAKFARRVHQVGNDHVHVVWNGIDLQEVEGRLSRSRQPAKEILSGIGLKRLCMVAAIKPDKDYVLALRVVRRLVDDDPTWRLICVGDELSDAAPGYKTDVLDELRRLGLEPFVTFVGHRRDVPEIIASSDLLLVTSVREGFPNVVLEAMACGTAVVSTNYSDVRRILPVARQVVDSRSAADIAEAVVRCHGMRVDIAAAQRSWVEANGTAAASTATMLGVYGGYVARSANVTARTAS
jgi:glycosyltransferase involved in cell wall biosynthesis